MTGVRLIQVPYYLGREHADLSRGPADARRLRSEARASSSSRPQPNVLPNEVAESFAVIRAVASTVRETVEQGRFPLVLAVNCFTSLGTVAGARPRRRRRLVRRPWRLQHARHDADGVPRRDGARHAARRRVARASALGRRSETHSSRARAARRRPRPRSDGAEARRVDSAPRRCRDARGRARRARWSGRRGLRARRPRRHRQLGRHARTPSPWKVASMPRSSSGALGAIAGRFEIAAAAMTAYDPSVDPEGRIPPIAATLAQRLVPERVAQ